MRVAAFGQKRPLILTSTLLFNGLGIAEKISCRLTQNFALDVFLKIDRVVVL
jgi:hypothetical protein